MDIDVGGTVYSVQKGGKIELGVASDHMTVYVDPDDWEGSVRRIDRQVRLHNYAKAMKLGILPAKPSEPGTELPSDGRKAE
jgi:hypothetical protein